MSRLGWPTLAAVTTAIVVTCASRGTADIPHPCTPDPSVPRPREWPTYRHDTLRTGHLPGGPVNLLGDPKQAQNLAVRWVFPPSGEPPVDAFRASPIVVNGAVYIGSTKGIFYALLSYSGDLYWQYPSKEDLQTGKKQPLTGSCSNGGNGSFGDYGIQSSASFAVVQGRNAVVFGAPDPDPNVDGGLGSARLWAVDAISGELILMSDVVAQVTGCVAFTDLTAEQNESLKELHERIAYSPPLIVGSTAYVGIHNAGDDPIQNGKVVAVDLNTGHRIDNFSYASTSTRGGGVWNGPASDACGVYFTTGNTRTWSGAHTARQGDPAMSPGGFNDGLSLMRVNPGTGSVAWSFSPIPFPIDNDPDWSAGAAVMFASCGELIVSVPKDGWTYAVNAADGSCAWQFPAMNHPQCVFPADDNQQHSDDDYKQPAALWNDVAVIKTGGEALPLGHGVTAGYTRLHALNVCAGENQRVRWIADIPSATFADGYSLGAPTITNGIIYVTTDQGHVVVLADPSRKGPPSLCRCSNIDFGLPHTDCFFQPGQPRPAWQTQCLNADASIVAVPVLLADVALPDGGNAAGLRMEPALAYDMVFVATGAGHVYALGVD